MSASTQEDVNTYVAGDRVKFNDKTHFLYGNKGRVTNVFGISVEIKLDDKLTVITSYKNLKKIKVVKQNGSGNTQTNNTGSKKRTSSGRVSKSSGSKKSRASKQKELD